MNHTSDSEAIQHVDTQPKQTIEVVVTGDTFVEQYIWPQADNRDGKDELPYTFPDDLRTAEPHNIFTELSGVPLHAQLFRAVLEAAHISEGKFTIRCVPDEDALRAAWNLRQDGGPFPVYLHHLGPFASIDAWNGAANKAWRFANSFGELRKPDPLRDADAKRIRKRLDSLIATTASVLQSLATPISNAPLVLIINDRNAEKYGYPESNIREIVKHITTKLMPDFLDHLQKMTPRNLLILWHTRAPLFRQDDALSELLTNTPLCGCTIPIVNYHCLRNEGVPLRFDVSYETTCRAMFSELDHEPLKHLKKFPHALIRFDYGVMHLTSATETLIGLDIHAFSGGPHAGLPASFGMMAGTTPLLLSAILRELCDTRDRNPIKSFFENSKHVVHPTLQYNTRLDRAIDTGLLLSGLHFRNGFGECAAGTPKCFSSESTAPLYGRLMEYLAKHAKWEHNDQVSAGSGAPSSICELNLTRQPGVPYLFERLTRFSVSGEMLGQSEKSHKAREFIARGSLFEDKKFVTACTRYGMGGMSIDSPELMRRYVVRRIVEYGLDKVVDRIRIGDNVTEPSVVCPHVSFGNFMSLDAADIDAFLGVRMLVEKYLAAADWKSPLAIAVFGRPGSGKSSLVKEVLRNIPYCVLDVALECNMSQWNTAEGLTRHFHKIRDRTVHGDVPIVLFDEFDSTLLTESCGWLKHFLMPLQDGLYIDKTDLFHVGKAIFVFAGGVAHSYKEFCDNFNDLTAQKVPDFVSRLKAYVDVQDIFFMAKGQVVNDVPHFVPTNENKAAQLRRATVLRGLLMRHLPQIIDKGSNAAQIDRAVSDAFLFVSHFEHGVRSMEAIIQASRVSARVPSFQPSALPPPDQLGMHVDKHEFLAILHHSMRTKESQW